MTVTAKVRREVVERDGHACVRCGTSMAREWSLHHRRPRGMGGSKDPATDGYANLLLLCGSGTTACHGWVEANRHDARADGLLLQQWQQPSHVPVLFHGVQWRLPCAFEPVWIE